METLEKDTDWLFEKVMLEKVGEDWINVAKERISTVSGDEVVEEYFKQLRKEDIVRLYNKYEVDFIMFDYDKEVEFFVKMGRWLGVYAKNIAFHYMKMCTCLRRLWEREEEEK